jgi:hypothetical protein
MNEDIFVFDIQLATDQPLPLLNLDHRRVEEERGSFSECSSSLPRCLTVALKKVDWTLVLTLKPGIRKVESLGGLIDPGSLKLARVMHPFRLQFRLGSCWVSQ